MAATLPPGSNPRQPSTPTLVAKVSSFPLPNQSSPEFPDPIPTLIPYGSICTLSGASGTGKTRMIAGWLRRFQDGKSICLHPTNKPSAIGIIAVDRRWAQYKDLFALVGLPHIPHYSFRDNPVFPWANLKTASGRTAALCMALDTLKLPPGSLVVIDPLSVFVTNRLMDYTEVAIGMSEIDKQLGARKLTLLGMFHTHKVYANPQDRTLRPQDRILGSGAQLAFTDTSLYLASPVEMAEPYYELGFIPHNAAAEQHHFIMGKTGLFKPFDQPDGHAGKTEERRAQILALIPEEGVTTAALGTLVEENYGVTLRTFYRDLQILRNKGLVETDTEGINRRKPLAET